MPLNKTPEPLSNEQNDKLTDITDKVQKANTQLRNLIDNTLNNIFKKKEDGSYKLTNVSGLSQVELQEALSNYDKFHKLVESLGHNSNEKIYNMKGKLEESRFAVLALKSLLDGVTTKELDNVVSGLESLGLLNGKNKDILKNIKAAFQNELKSNANVFGELELEFNFDNEETVFRNKLDNISFENPKDIENIALDLQKYQKLITLKNNSSLNNKFWDLVLDSYTKIESEWKENSSNILNTYKFRKLLPIIGAMDNLDSLLPELARGIKNNIRNELMMRAHGTSKYSQKVKNLEGNKRYYQSKLAKWGINYQAQSTDEIADISNYKDRLHFLVNNRTYTEYKDAISMLNHKDTLYRRTQLRTYITDTKIRLANDLISLDATDFKTVFDQIINISKLHITNDKIKDYVTQNFKDMVKTVQGALQNRLLSSVIRYKHAKGNIKNKKLQEFIVYNKMLSQYNLAKPNIPSMFQNAFDKLQSYT